MSSSATGTFPVNIILDSQLFNIVPDGCPQYVSTCKQYDDLSFERSVAEYINKLHKFIKTVAEKYPLFTIFGWRPTMYSHNSDELEDLKELLRSIPATHEPPKNLPIVIIIGLPDFPQRFASVDSKIIHHALDGTSADLGRFDKIIMDIYNPEKYVDMHLPHINKAIHVIPRENDKDDMPPGPARLPIGTKFYCRIASDTECLPPEPDPNAPLSDLEPCASLPPLRRTLTQVQPIDAEIDDEIPCPRCAAKYAKIVVVEGIPDVPYSLPPLEKECPDCHDLGFLKVFPPQP